MEHRFTVKHNGVVLMDAQVTTTKHQWPAMAIHMADIICDEQESAPEGNVFELDLHEDAVRSLKRDEARRKAGYIIYWR